MKYASIKTFHYCKQLEASKRAGRPIKLVIIDPISNYLGDVSMMAEQEVRSILVPFKQLAEEYNLAIVVVMHLNKKNDLDAINRVGGAMAFVGVSRTAWLFQRAPNLENKEELKNSFHMLRIKNNLVALSDGGLSFNVEVAKVRVKRPKTGETEDDFVPHVAFTGATDATAQEVLRPARHKEGRPPKHAAAEIDGWLANYLRDGADHHSTEVKQAGQEEHGLTKDELLDAGKRLGVAIDKVGKVWMWRMQRPEPKYPDAEPLSLVHVEGLETA